MPARRSPIGTSYHSRESLPADESPANRSSWRRSAEIAGAPTILKGEVVSPGIMKIIRLEESTSENQWELARLYARELAKPGMTTRELGNLVSKSHTYVRLMAKTWTEKGAGLADSLPPFSEMYALAKAPKPKPDPKPGTEDTGAGFSYDELVKCGAGTRQASDQQFLSILAEVCREKGLESRTSGTAAAEFRMETAVEKAQKLLRKAQQREKAASNGSVPAGNGPQPGCTCVTCPVHGGITS